MSECAEWRGWMWKRLIVARVFMCVRVLHIECVSVLLPCISGMQSVYFMRRMISVACQAMPYFATMPHKRQVLRKK